MGLQVPSVPSESFSPREFMGGHGNKVLSFNHAGKGDVIRMLVDMRRSIVISCVHWQPSIAEMWNATPKKVFDSLDFSGDLDIYPFISFDSTCKFHLHCGHTHYPQNNGFSFAPIRTID